MKRLTNKQIADAFTASSAQQDNTYIKGFNKLSAALYDLQQAGLDVDLELFGKSTEQGFKMNVDRTVESLWQNTGGILRIGNFHSLVAIFTELKRPGQERETCFWVAVSNLDIRYEHENSSIRHNAFDLMHDPEALIKFQEFIISIAATQKKIAAADIHQAFKSKAPTATRRLSPLPAGTIKKSSLT